MVAALSRPQPSWDDIEEPDVTNLVIEDDTPVDGIFTEKQERVLTEPLYSSWAGPPPELLLDGVTPPAPVRNAPAVRPFAVLANVGLFSTPEEPPVVPDVMLSVDVRLNEDLTEKKNRSYFLWRIGKAPDVVIEIVSNREGGELDTKLRRYQRVGVPHYVVFDPLKALGGAELRSFQLTGGKYIAVGRPWFGDLGLTLAVWEGEFEGMSGRWLRWYDLDRRLIPTGLERAEAERLRAEAERLRAEIAEKRAARLLEKLKAAGIDPTEVD